MKAEFAGRYVRTSGTNVARHVENTQPASSLSANSFDGLPLLLDGPLEVLERAGDADLTIEPVGIGEEHRALGAVDLEDAVSEQRCVEAEQALRRSALLEFGEDRDVREYLHRKFSARTRSLPDPACGQSSPAGRRDLSDRTQQVDQCGEVVRAHVEDRAASRCEQELRIDMKPIRPLPLEACHRGLRRSDSARTDCAYPGLPASAQQRIWSDAKEQAALPGKINKRPRRFSVDGDGLLAPDMLPGLERGG